MESGITWYDVLGVLPGAEAGKIKRNTSRGRPAAAGTGLGCPAGRGHRRPGGRSSTGHGVGGAGRPGEPERLDEAAGRRPHPPGTGTGSARPGRADPGITGELPGVTCWLAPRRRRNRPGAVPDVRGLFYHVCLEVATRHGLHVMTVRLTERPMAVDGLVVDQDPRPPTKVYRGDKLTVQVWHPPARE